VILGHVVRYGVGMGEQPGGICIVLVDAVQDALFLVGDAAAGVVGRFVAAGVDAAVGMEAQEQRGFQVVQPGVVFVIDSDIYPGCAQKPGRSLADAGVHFGFGEQGVAAVI